MALTLYYHPLSSFCHKVLITLYENQTPFSGQFLDLGNEAQRAAFVALWPTGRMPLLRDDQRIVAETSIIMEYLDRNYPGARPLLPRDFEASLEARLWDRLFDLYVMQPMQKVVGDTFRPQGEHDRQGVAEAIATLRMAYGMIENKLAERTWAAGAEFTIADCSAAPSLFYASIIEPFSSGNARLAAYFERLLARPSVKRVLSEARPYFNSFPLKERIPARFLTD